MSEIGKTVFIAAVITTAVIVTRLRRRRARHRAQAWSDLQQGLRGQAHVVRVARVYQRARRGSKAWVVWCESGQLQDTWFEGWHVPVGAHVLLSGSRGYGPHNDNPNVLYVERHQVHGWAPGWVARRSRTGF